jgi:hypothetical protein
MLLFSALLAGAAAAAPGDKSDVVRNLAVRVGPIVGSASACRDIARPRIQLIVEKTHDIFPGLIYTSVLGVGGTALADELLRLGPRYASGVIVTQAAPAVSGYSSLVLDYKNSLARYFPGQSPDYVSLEGFIPADILIEAIKLERQASHNIWETAIDENGKYLVIPTVDMF